jgi:hypothetical protein
MHLFDRVLNPRASDSTGLYLTGLAWCETGLRQLRFCWCGAPSLTRGLVCRLQLLLALASVVILGFESRGTHGHILLSQIRDTPNLEVQVTYLYPPGTGWPSYTPRHWVLFPSPPTTRRATVEVFEPASTRGIALSSARTTVLTPFPTVPILLRPDFCRGNIFVCDRCLETALHATI